MELRKALAKLAYGQGRIDEYIWPDLDRYTVNKRVSPEEYRVILKNTRHLDEYNNAKKNVLVELRTYQDKSTMVFALQFSDLNYRTRNVLPEKAKLIVHVGTWPNGDMAKQYVSNKLNK